MNKSKISLLFAGVLAVSSVQVLAGDGSVHFTGAVTEDTCTVGTEINSQPVELGNIPSALFNAAGDKSSAVDFTIELSNCPASVLQVLTKFDGVSNPSNTALLSLDSGATATGVGIEIAEEDETPIPLHTASKPYTVDATTHNASLPYVARYVATDAIVGAGTANGTSQFTLNYQ